jgi:hypothetical protein
MQIYALKMNQWFNGGDDFWSDCIRHAKGLLN